MNVADKIESELRLWVSEAFGKPFSETATYNRQLDSESIRELAERLAKVQPVAAAPELLKACVEMVDVSSDTDPQLWVDALDKMASAIKKATGA